VETAVTITSISTPTSSSASYAIKNTRTPLFQPSGAAKNGILRPKNAFVLKKP